MKVAERVSILILENDPGVFGKLKELEGDLKRESSRRERWPLLDVEVHDEPSKAADGRWDVVMTDLILTLEDREKINDWVMSWHDKPDAEVYGTLDVDWLDSLHSVQVMHEGSERARKIVAYFTKVGFSEVTKYILERGAWYHLKPEPITKRIVQNCVSKRSELEDLVDAADEAVLINWDWVKEGLRSIIEKLALQVIAQRLRMFWPLDIEKALRAQTLGQLAVPSYSFAVLVDLAKSSKGRASLSPEAHWQDLCTFFEEIYKSVYAHGGWVESFLGDGVLAHFGTLSWIEERRQMSREDAFEKSLITFLEDVSRVNVPKFASDVRIMATYLMPTRSDTGVVGSEMRRASLITSSDEINTCAHIMKEVFEASFFDDCHVRLAFLDPRGSPISNSVEDSVQAVGQVVKQDVQKTKELLKGEPIEDATIYLMKV